MSYPSVNTAPAYYSSSKDSHYRAAPVKVVATPSAYGTYASPHAYGHSATPVYSSAYHASNTSSYTTYSSSGYSSSTALASTPRSQSSSQYYHQPHSGQAYGPSHSSSKPFEPKHGSGYSNVYSKGPSAAMPPSSSSSMYPASPSRPFQCELCPLSFDRSHDLKRHR